MAMTMVADDVTIALLRGSVQLWRNGVFGVTKLVFLAALVLLVAHGTGLKSTRSGLAEHSFR